MGVLTLIGGLAVVLIVVLWAVTKLFKYRLSVDEEEDRRATEDMIGRVVQLTYLVLMLMALAEFWPGVESFAADTFDLITNAL
jgi:heme/copper-type cytochrome/quinol oxidase subunit 2